MDKPVFVDYETKIYAAYLNAVAATVWDALGQATNPQDARHFIGAVEEAPQNGSSYARKNAQWFQIQVGNLHNDLTGRSAADAHPVSAITGLQASLDQINLDLSGKAPTSAGTAVGTSFSPTGAVAATNVQSAVQELDSEKAPLASPTFTGAPSAPTPTVGDSTTKIATTAFVNGNFVAKAGATMTGTLTGTLFAAPRDQLGISATAANNFTLDASANNGTMKLARGNAGATTQDILTVDAAGKPRFNQLAQSLAVNGYKVLDGGLIIQWGRAQTGLTGIGVTFPIQFTTFSNIVVSPYSASEIGATAQNQTLTSVFIQAWAGNGDSTPVDATVMWFAIGF